VEQTKPGCREKLKERKKNGERELRRERGCK
jgi:hypothetical protein